MGSTWFDRLINEVEEPTECVKQSMILGITNWAKLANPSRARGLKLKGRANLLNELYRCRSAGSARSGSGAGAVASAAPPPQRRIVVFQFDHDSRSLPTDVDRKLDVGRIYYRFSL